MPMRDLWFERAGWEAAHLLLAGVRPDKTLCARIAPGGWVEASFSAWRCGQCLARRRARPDAAVRQFVSVVDVLPASGGDAS